ncbi:MAG: hypothetical protein FWC67_04125, partial [Defluviitaleaceae bacterium]|nr:hypothetical protein [Defluviitaleaceae bacterium]
VPIYLHLAGFESHQAIMTGTNPVTIEIRALGNEMRAISRENVRQYDFAYFLEHLGENYPFFEMALRRGVNIEAITEEALESLEATAREVGRNFLWEFVNDNFTSHFNGLGQLYLASEQTHLGAWITHPYFYGYEEFRFYTEGFDLPMRNDNLVTTMAGDGTAHMRVNSFLARGYEGLMHQPFWRFDFEAEQNQIMEFYSSLGGTQDLFIDIRGINEGFCEYFIPLILEPNITAPIEATFYAFHMNGTFANGVSRAFRAHYGIAAPVNAQTLSANMPYANENDFEHLRHGFAIPLSAQPAASQPAFGGNIWLITDSCNFSGPNQMYLYLAQLAGFNIIYEQNSQSRGWATAYHTLPFSGFRIRLNPLYFTDSEGRALEEFRIVTYTSLSDTLN